MSENQSVSVHPLATAAECAAAKTSHLTGFSAPKVDNDDTPDDEPLPVVVESEFPDNLKEAFELLETIKAERPADKRAEKLKQAKLTALAKHLAKLQQMPDPGPAPVFKKYTPKESAVGKATSPEQITALRARIAFLKKRAPASPKRSVETETWSGIRASLAPQISAIGKIVSDFGVLRSFYEMNGYAENARHSLIDAICESKPDSLEEFLAATSRLRALHSITPHEVTMLNRMINAFWFKFLDAAKLLLRDALAAADKNLADGQAAESSLFKKQNLTPQATELTNGPRAVISKIQSLITHLEGMNSTPYSHGLQWPNADLLGELRPARELSFFLDNPAALTADQVAGVEAELEKLPAA
jgi:hypothetical protein